MITINFSGWYQCRLSTDPDAYDELRGVSGWTFAMSGEPDLDRIIRFQNPVAARSHGPTVGVSVVSVEVNGANQPSHPLIGAAVDLLDAPVFEGRNGQIAPSAQEPIVPWTLRLVQGGFELVTHDPIDLSDLSEIARRTPIDFIGNSPEVAAATGITDRAAYRATRKAQLEADLTTATDPDIIAALTKRIDELGKGSIRLQSLGFQLSYEHELRGPNRWQDNDGLFVSPPADGETWRTEFWTGGWDADALCGFIQGRLLIG